MSDKREDISTETVLRTEREPGRRYEAQTRRGGGNEKLARDARRELAEPPRHADHKGAGEGIQP